MLLIILAFFAVGHFTSWAGMRFDNSEHRFWFEAHVAVALFLIVLVLL